MHSSSNLEPLLIFPCNGNGIEALDCIGEAYRVLGFVDDNPEKQGCTVYGYSVFDREALARWPDAKVLAVPGSPTSYRTRTRLIDGLMVPAERLAKVIHPRATISPLATIGRNVLIMAGVVLTSNVVIGSHVCILPNTVLHHDAVIGDWCLLGSNVTIAGSTVVGDNCYIGSGSTLMNGLEVGPRALVGVGSSVIRNVPADARAAGSPAKLL